MSSLSWCITGTLLLCLLTPVVSATFTISISGSSSHYLGDDIVLSGIDTESSTVYLFLTGPGLPSQGAQIASLEPRKSGVQNGNSDTFTMLPVPPLQTWSWTWPTGDVSLDAGTYQIFAVGEPRDRNSLRNLSYSSVTLIFKKPFTSSTTRTVLVSPDATVFIGESGLDLGNIVGKANAIAWWPSAADAFTTSPTKMIPIARSGHSFFVDPSQFTGYTGRWYAYEPPQKYSAYELPPQYVNSQIYFTVADPSLDLTVRNADTGRDISGSSVPSGTSVGFQVETNLYLIANGGRKNAGSDTDGFIDIIVTGPAGGQYWNLFNQTGSPQQLSGLFVDHQPYSWGDPMPASVSSWATGSIVNGKYRYPSGTYTIHAESTLNGMKGNYRNGGADYTGKTVSPAYLITLTQPWEAAYSVVNTNVLQGNPARKPVFVSSTPLPPRTVVDTWRSKVNHTTPAGDPGWLFFIDDNPDANWEHPARFYLVDARNTAILDHWDSWSPPTTVSLDYAGGGSPQDTGGSNAPGGSGGAYFAQPFAATGAPAIPACKPDCSTYHALLISGGISKDYNYYRYWNDISFMYKALNQTYGYPSENITVLMSDGTDAGNDSLVSYGPPVVYTSSNTNLDGKYGTTDVNGNATRATVLAALTNLNKTLTSADTLFIFTTNHGGNVSPTSRDVVLYLWGGGTISDKDFVGNLPKTAGNITLMMEQCFGGGFIDEFTGAATSQNRVITTAANWNEYSWGNAFSYPWISAVAGHDNAYPQPNGVNADTQAADGRVSMSEAYTFAKANDAYYTLYSPPKETPQIAVKNANSSTAFLADCKAVSSLKVTEPDTTVTWIMNTPHTIHWTQTGLSGTPVKIELWNGSTPVYVRDIATVSDAAAGAVRGYPLIVPNVTAANNYRIKIYSANDPGVSDLSDTTFTIGPFSRDGNGTLKVNSTPAGAIIFIDNAQQKNTSTGASILTNASFTVWGGTHFVGVYLEGYYRKDPTQYNVPVGGNVTAVFPLENISPNDCTPYGRLVIHTMPVQGAKVLIDGRETGQNTNAVTELAPGTYTVQVDLDGYASPPPQNITIPQPQCGMERVVVADFTLRNISGIAAKMRIVPHIISTDSRGYAIALIGLPAGNTAAEVDPGSVVCEGSPALRLYRMKFFPRVLIAVFRSRDLNLSPGAMVPVSAGGMIQKPEGNRSFTGTASVRVIDGRIPAFEFPVDWPDQPSHGFLWSLYSGIVSFF